MDDYVRRSFEGHEELPPDDMWGRIEAGLPDDRRPAMRLWFVRNRWPAAAAAMLALLLSVSVCQYRYYEKKLEEVRRAATQGSKTVPAVPTRPTSENAPPTSRGAFMDTNGAAVSHQSSAQAREEANSGQQPTNQTEPVFTVPNGQRESAEIKEVAVPHLSPQQSISVISLVLEAVVSLDDFNPAGQLGAYLAPSAQQQVRPLKKPSSWYVGFSASPHFRFEKNRSTPLRPGVRPIVASKQEKVAFSSVYWLNVGKKMGRSPYFVETGVGYETTVRMATHSPRLRFGDGSSAGGAMWQRRYNYIVGTYNGTAEVGLRMEQTTPGAPTNDDEPIVLTIQTRETAEMLHFPLLGGVEWGRGWLKGRAKAGMVFNSFLKNELEITASVSQNARFRPVGGRSHTVQLEESRAFFPSYWISAGASVQAGKHLRFVAEPWLSGDFSRKDASGNPLPQQIGAGLNISGQYIF
jgi:hypothetical protein